MSAQRSCTCDHETGGPEHVSEFASDASPSSPPRTITGKLATVAAVQRHHEFLAWVESRPLPQRDDEEVDVSYKTFMRERRARKEAEREQARRVQRWAARGLQVPERELRPTPAELQCRYEAYCAEFDILLNRYTWRRFLKDRTNEKRRRAYAARRGAQYGPQRKRGRPADPEVAKRRDAQRQLAQQRIQEWMTACAQQRGTGRKPRARSRRCSDGAQPRAWSTEGQCEGRTRDGDRCKVHRSSRYAVAAPLRRGERFCGHHHPDKYTGVRWPARASRSTAKGSVACGAARATRMRCRFAAAAPTAIITACGAPARHGQAYSAR